MSILSSAAKLLLDGNAHEQTITHRQLFVGHMSGSEPVERRENESLGACPGTLGLFKLPDSQIFHGS